MISMTNHEICRTCQSTTDLFDIFDEYNTQLISLLQQIAGLDIRDDDQLPKYICLDCSKTVTMAHTFIVDAQRTDRLLRDRLSALTTTSTFVKSPVSDIKLESMKIELLDSQTIDSLIENETSNNNEDEPQVNTNFDGEQPPAAIRDAKSSQPTINDFDVDKVSVKIEPFEVVVASTVNPSNQYFELIEEDEKFNIEHIDDGVDKREIDVFNLDDIIEVDEDYVEDDYAHMLNYINTEVAKTACDLVKVLQPGPEPNTRSPEVVKQCDYTEISSKSATKSLNVVKKCDSTELLEPEPVTKYPIESKRKLIVRLQKLKSPLKQPQKEQNIFNCIECSATFPNFSEYKRHRKSHGSYRFVCSVCKRVFKNSYRLRTHLNIHNGVKFPCNLCNKQCSSHGNLTRHIRQVHDKERPYPCETCGKQYNRGAGLRKHLLVCNKPREEYKFHCSKCSRKFISKERLAFHQYIHAPGYVRPKTGIKRIYKPFICEHCGKVCKSQGSYQQHVLQVHTEDRAMACPVCPKRFKTKEVLRKHMQCHTDERPYSCDLCGKAFRQPAHLNSHKKSIHAPASSRPFECNYCKKRYVTLPSLRAHERIHTGEKPYQCDMCEESFIDATVLKKHKHKVHSIPVTSRKQIAPFNHSITIVNENHALESIDDHYVEEQDVIDTFNQIVNCEL